MHPIAAHHNLPRKKSLLLSSRRHSHNKAKHQSKRKRVSFVWHEAFPLNETGLGFFFALPSFPADFLRKTHILHLVQQFEAGVREDISLHVGLLWAPTIETIFRLHDSFVRIKQFTFYLWDIERYNIVAHPFAVQQTVKIGLRGKDRGLGGFKDAIWGTKSLRFF